MKLEHGQIVFSSLLNAMRILTHLSLRPILIIRRFYGEFYLFEFLSNTNTPLRRNV